ncbi:DNA/RNA helicase, superfamily I [Thermoplasmatales archaeon SCGC AB-540-F20]|nr:DNA/RNA helicase, superfamily I [Thermoplasmatales archaeon SCGC AB-540-F20]
MTNCFCVGDDWQSIYGFRGSNVEYIVNFQKYFKNPSLIKLNLNYRSNNTIVEASNELIKHNRFKIEKEINSFNTTGKKIYLYCAQKELEDGVDTVVKNIDQLLKNGFTKDDILVLSRTRKSDAFERYYEELNKRKIRLTTIHQSKGLEAEIVFIIGLNRGYHGFPNVRDDDRIFQVIKKSDYEKNLEEERRLFYVAVTRAKQELFLISEVGNESEFISEIPGEFIDRENFLILNIKSQTQKLCSNCNKKIEEAFTFCPHCGKKYGSDVEQEKPYCAPKKVNVEFESKDKLIPEDNKQIILRCLKEMKVNTGRSLLSNVLKGSKVKPVVNTKTQYNTYHGSLSK